jgi:hypothetical protein
MHTRPDAGRVSILIRRDIDWTHKYPAVAHSIAGLPAEKRTPISTASCAACRTATPPST